MTFRLYNAEQDKDAAYRIWQECGWMGHDDEEKKAVDVFLDGGRVMVADLNGEPECLVASMPASIRYLDEVLALDAITSVTTSRIARKRGLARRLTARVIAENAAEGAEMSGLGMFEQGFYNLLGFGAMGYELQTSFDPAQITVKQRFRVPHRLTKDDYQLVHDCMVNRMPVHGGVFFNPVNFVQAELMWGKDVFGLGYCDGPDGELTHFFAGKTKGENGPMRIWWFFYQTWDQFLELMALLKSFGDQIRKVTTTDPAGVQMQDFIRQPFRFQALTRKSEFESGTRAVAWSQLRICDLAACFAKTHLPDPDTVRFNLELTDPITAYLDDDAPWGGISGEYIVTLGPESEAKPGSDPALPTMQATVPAFTRLWMGVQTPTLLSVSSQVSAPPELLAALDDVLRLPVPRLEWGF